MQLQPVNGLGERPETHVKRRIVKFGERNDGEGEGLEMGEYGGMGLFCELGEYSGTKWRRRKASRIRKMKTVVGSGEWLLS